MTALPMIPGMIQIEDANGVPVAGGLIATYAVGGLTPKPTYQDFAATIQNPNPIPLDSAGRCVLWGNGRYRLIVTDANGNELWDRETVGAIDLNTTATVGIPFIVDGDGATITTGVKGSFQIPFAATITGNTVLAPKESGSIQFDIWKAPLNAFPPTGGNSIVASAPPKIVGAQFSNDTGLAGWNTVVNAGDTFIVSVSSCSGITNATLELTAVKTL